MFKRLLVAEHVIADLTLANSNVTYKLRVRHGVVARATLPVCADRLVQTLPFDVKLLRVLPYAISADGSLPGGSSDPLADSACQSLKQARTRQIPLDNPVMQITAWKPPGNIEHSKTHVFLQRVQYTGELGEGIKAAIFNSNKDVALSRLNEVIDSLQDVAQMHTALIGVYLGYRELKAQERMTSLFSNMPKELQHTAFAREQYALALNRLAKIGATQKTSFEGDELRKTAFSVLDEIPSSLTSEAYGIGGRMIYKGWHDVVTATLGKTDPHEQAVLQKAIKTYEQGFRKDLRHSSGVIC